MKQKTSFYNKIKALFLAFVSNHTYLVFRRFESETGGQSFDLHFKEPFKSKKAAQEAIDFAKVLEPWQEFIILYGC